MTYVYRASLSYINDLHNQILKHRSRRHALDLPGCRSSWGQTQPFRDNLTELTSLRVSSKIRPNALNSPCPSDPARITPSIQLSSWASLPAYFSSHVGINGLCIKGGQPLCLTLGTSPRRRHHSYSGSFRVTTNLSR